MEEKDKNVLFELGPDIREGLNVAAILPHLVKHHLTTGEERESLLSSSTTAIEKKNKLIFLWLPHKGNNSLSRFVEALRDSKDEEPTHETLAGKIQAKRTEGGSHCMHVYSQYIVVAAIMSLYSYARTYLISYVSTII